MLQDRINIRTDHLKKLSLAVEPQLLGRDGAEDLLGVGLAAGDLEQGGAAEVQQPGPGGRVAELAASADRRRSAGGVAA